MKKIAHMPAVALAVLAILGLGATSEKMLTASGSITKVDAAERSIIVAVTDGPETRFVWTSETKINGTLTPGAKVTIRYTVLPEGQNLAHQVSVARS